MLESVVELIGAKPSWEVSTTVERMQSIRTKMLSVTVLVIFALSFLLGLASFVVVQRLAQTDSEELMSQKCEEESIRLNDKLNLIRHSVTMITEYSKELNEVNKLDSLSAEYLNQVRELAVTAANDTDGAMAVYFRYNPELTGSGTSGFFWSKSSTDAYFKEEPCTDILAYNPSDVEHVGWFYAPKNAGKSIWMDPYYNKNLGVFMISYITPVYTKDNRFLGVIGMDIDFHSIIKEMGKAKIYKTGRLSLVDENTDMVYFWNSDNTTAKDRLPKKLNDDVSKATNKVELITTTETNGNQYLKCFTRLDNDMVLYLSVPMNEINENRDSLMLIMVIVTLIVGGLAIVIIWRNTSNIVKPINRLAQVANNYARGNWDDKYVCETNDELQVLSESIAKMADQTKRYISNINDLVRFDSMTGVRNRTSYSEKVQQIKDNSRNKYEKWAIVVLDLNFLKQTNDNLGHEAGDKLITEAAKYICNTFEHSAVFRIGGDEFVAIMMNEDYDNRDELLRSFEEGLGYEVVDGAKLSISYGMATSEEESNYDKAFILADERMYAKKAEMKRLGMC